MDFWVVNRVDEARAHAVGADGWGGLTEGEEGGFGLAFDSAEERGEWAGVGRCLESC